ncbi:MAG: A/G-specific adenine glycosylase [Candidatus Fraserbacteria bacterium RBG_16_55_9]|uniref:Adenine DNA glycosylase n=1 Tax=Fraserbacteria sp. (strain RBG_16_55_9) TaxID=1817864 RepID=A0A1F5UR91_FRAXR|nr:MAG: A/G-specific adenine glycosylase [Candidatus Fraserbacteria bacterium RBG_16_55_9]
MKRFVQNLLNWYEANRRTLPWRKTKDSYRIWVAETMLQQTRVAAAKRYYERFIEEFPTVESLAQASLDRVLKVWEGLGYYARARNLHCAAQIVTQEHNGVLPKDKRELLSLPGIGRYTVGAILSIAFGQDEPVLDGNIRRVLCRVFHVTENPRLRRVERRLELLLVRLLPKGHAGTFNQALMELGATICTPRVPRCAVCPVEELCVAKRLGVQSELPVSAPRRALPHHEVAVGVIWKGDRLLVAQRPPEGLLGGLWEFPGGKRKPDETLEECLLREVHEELGIIIHVKRHLTTVQHGYSHFRVTLHAFECNWRRGKPQTLGCSDWAWVRINQLGHYAFPRANQKIMEALT